MLTLFSKGELTFIKRLHHKELSQSEPDRSFPRLLVRSFIHPSACSFFNSFIQSFNIQFGHKLSFKYMLCNEVALLQNMDIRE